MKKSITLIALVTLLFLGVSGGSTHAKTISTLRRIETTYNASKKAVTFSGTVSSKKTTRVTLVYNNGKKTVVNVKKGAFKVAKKFRGYKTFSLYGTNKKSQRTTRVYKLTSAKYATATPTILKLDHSAKNGTVVVNVKAPKQSQIQIYNAKKNIANVKSNGKTQTLKLKSYKGKTIHFRLNAKQRHLKTSKDVYTPKIKQGIIYQVSY